MANKKTDPASKIAGFYFGVCVVEVDGEAEKRRTANGRPYGDFNNHSLYKLYILLADGNRST